MGIHPDVIVIGEDGVSLKVDQVRALRADAYVRPNEAERKIYVVENSQTLNQSGQNALLKLLEEGPDYAAFFFLLPNPEQLLPTLRSRCETIRGETYQTECQNDHEAQEFSNLICQGNQETLITFCVGLEKKKREELVLLLDQTIEELISHLTENPERLLPRLDALREVRASCEYTVGVGHIAGWLMAALTEK
jgi:DNA polymerase-3 subunit delta'